ncbi:MAG: hydratase, partial [Treponema sp.]|nr:hydratase [Treponema sp.]
MVEVYSTGAYLVQGSANGGPGIIRDDAEAGAKLAAAGISTSKEVSFKEKAREGTIAHGILAAHDTGGDGENLRLKFDSLTSHDITYVGIIQTARASGMERFPVPYVLTNCHNSLCAVGGT